MCSQRKQNNMPNKRIQFQMPGTDMKVVMDQKNDKKWKIKIKNEFTKEESKLSDGLSVKETMAFCSWLIGDTKEKLNKDYTKNKKSIKKEIVKIVKKRKINK